LIFGTGSDGSYATERTDSNLDDPYYTQDFVSAWYLTEVISANRQDTISFKYKMDENDTVKLEDYSVPTNESLVLGPNIPYEATGYLKANYHELSRIEKKYLDTIRFKNGYIKFESSTGRQDLEDDYKLDAIKVYGYDDNGSEILIDQYHFVYEYFLRSGGVFSEGYEDSPISFSFDRQINSRNKSLKLTEMYRGPSGSKHKHKFEYNTTTLPSRCTTAQDFWGYCNNNTGTLLPETFATTQAMNVVYFHLGNGDRDSDEAKMKAGVLEKIIYPTGGYTVFEHEANKYMTTEPVMRHVIQTVQAYGDECNDDPIYPGYIEKNFTIPANATNIVLNKQFSPVEHQGSYTPYVFLDSMKYYRPAPDPNCNDCAVDSSPGGEEITNLTFGMTLRMDPLVVFNPGSHTIKAFDTSTIGDEFPPHSCSFLSISVSWDEPDSIQQSEKAVGGLRIKSISNYDGKSTTPVSVKKYEYQSHNLIQPLRNKGYIRKFYSSADGMLETVVSSSPHFNNNLGGEPVIEYGKVTEYDYNPVTQLNNGKIVSYFKTIQPTLVFGLVSLITIPFKHDQFSLLYNYGNGSNSFSDLLVKGLIWDAAYYGLEEFTFYETTSWKRGKLIKEEVYKSTDTDTVLIKTIDNIYETINSDTLYSNYIFANWEDVSSSWYVTDSPYDQDVDFNSMEYSYQIGETLTGRKVLKQTIETIYDQDGQNQKVDTIYYYYDNPAHLQLTRTKTADNEGREITKKTYYPEDITSAGSLAGIALTQEQYKAVDSLKAQHRISEPVQQEVYIDYDEDGVTDSEELLSIKRTVYKNWGSGMIMPEKIATQYGEETTTNHLEDKIVYHQINGFGNVEEVYKSNDIHVSYIWSYNHTSPVIKGENINYTALQSAVSAAVNSLTGTYQDLDDLMEALIGKMDSGPGNLRDDWKDFNEALRTDASMSDAMITTYTYDPLIGMTSQTGPAGITTYYEYDGFGRLMQTEDLEDHIREKYNYNYHEVPELSVSPNLNPNALAHNDLHATVSSNIKWTVTDDQTWITVSPASDSATAQLTISVTANPLTSSRPGEVTVSDNSGSGLPDRTITITQAGIVPSLTLSKYLVNLYGSYDEDDVGVTSNVSWSWYVDYYDDYGWLSVHNVAGSGYNGTLQISSIDTPPYGETWHAEIEVSGGGITRHISVYLSN